MDIKSCDALLKSAEAKLKTSFFSFKFSSDYVGAVDDYTAAAKGFRKLGNYQKSLVAYKKAVECNRKLNDYYSEGNDYAAMAEIYFFDLKKIDKGIEMLNKASYAYQVSGKFPFAMKTYITTAERYMANQDYENAEKILQGAFDTCSSNPEDKLVGPSFEQIYNKLLDVKCGLKNWPKAIELTQKYIDAQLQYPDRDGYRLSKTYMKLCILRIINGEDYLCETIFGQMYDTKYDDTTTDVSDIRKVIDAIKFLDKKKFTYCISSAFTLFENNLLKGLQAVYKKKEEDTVIKGDMQDKIEVKPKEGNEGGEDVIDTSSKANPAQNDEEDML